jgi:Domain of unknown function (DUF5047)
MVGAVVIPGLTPEFLDLFRYSRRVSTRFDLYTGGTLVVRDILITDGSIKASRKDNARRTLSATIAMQPWETLPIDVYSSRIMVWLGLELDVHTPRLIPAGFFRVNTINRDQVKSFGIEGTSFEAYVIDDKFFAPRKPPTGTSTIAAIQTLIRESFAGAVFVITATHDKAIAMTAPWERERWEAVTSLADSIAAEVYCDTLGQFVIRDAPSFDPAKQVPVWAVNAGPNGVLVTENMIDTRAAVYNAVVVTASSSGADAPVVWAVAQDTEPTSMTRWSGPYGHAVQHYSNANITTLAQCQQISVNMLDEATAVNHSVDFSMVPNPALEPDDVVVLTHLDGTKVNHIIDSLDIPLGLGEWTATTAVNKIDVGDQGT